VAWRWVGQGNAEARWGARLWPVSAWWAGAGGQSSEESWNPALVETRSAQGRPDPHRAPSRHRRGARHAGNPNADMCKPVCVYVYVCIRNMCVVKSECELSCVFMEAASVFVLLRVAGILTSKLTVCFIL